MKQISFGFWVPDSDVHFEHCLENPKKGYKKGLYQIHVVTECLKHIQNKRLAIDVGAHVGLLTKQFAPHFDSIIAFEPSPENIECFRSNVLEKNVELRAFGLGARREVRLLAITANNSGANFIQLSSTHGRQFKKVKIEVYPLDYWTFEHLDFIKIDIQGMELEMIYGAEKTIKKHRPVICVECVDNKSLPVELRYGIDAQAPRKLLESWGMRLAGRTQKDFVMTW